MDSLSDLSFSNSSEQEQDIEDNQQKEVMKNDFECSKIKNKIEGYVQAIEKENGNSSEQISDNWKVISGYVAPISLDKIETQEEKEAQLKIKLERLEKEIEKARKATLQAEQVKEAAYAAAQEAHRKYLFLEDEKLELERNLQLLSQEKERIAQEVKEREEARAETEKIV
ncbi:hypothetical protein EIN_346540 [Entamoeba invadens IP1]|uniref:Uncharacterized protein n=1 Tax=Entamoeba invadens IP1 TaxID=370355 RepID=L7FJC8_ENTIV|nr:hypothetical protein EIN_346540 [Entamoeba invadens IP1]ELP84017.1 hypothetical protein EIN_346540 [Entamoeba invadens IP1]|eukprot:XP_004183363.1 hypothetical protein EIN_346540 [Entamoeba invadens IP1]